MNALKLSRFGKLETCIIFVSVLGAVVAMDG